MNNEFISIDSLIFDLDGTLWNAVSGVTSAWNIALKEDCICPLFTEDDVRGIMGLTSEAIKAKLFPHMAKESRDALFNKCSQSEQTYLKKHGAKLYPKVKETLATLSSSYPLFIVSNCGHGYIEAFLDYYNLRPYIKDFEYFARTQLEKGENIKLVMERNNLKSSIYVGDTQGDYCGAKLANIPFAYAEYGFGEVTNADFTLAKLEDLIDILPNKK